MKKWFILKNDQKYGPYTKDEILELYDIGSLNDSDLVQDEQTLETSLYSEIFKDHKTQQQDNDVTLPSLPMDSFKTKTNISVPDLPIEEEDASVPDLPTEESETQTDITIPSLPLDEYKTKTNIKMPELPALEEDDQIPLPPDDSESLTQEVQLAKVGFEREDDLSDGEEDQGLTKEVQLAQFKLDEESKQETKEKEIEIEIIEKDKPTSKKKIIIISMIGLFLVGALFIAILLMIDLGPDDSINKKLNNIRNTNDIVKKVNNDFEKGFVSIKEFNKHPLLFKMIQDKSRGLDLKIDGEVLAIDTCYKGNFLALKSDVSDTGKTNFKITKVIKRYPKKVKFFKYKCVKHDVEATLDKDLGFGKLVSLKVFYCPVYVDKAFSFKRKYNLTQKCYGIKDFNQCWQRVSQDLMSKRPYELLTKDNAAKEYIEMVTFITHEKVRLENSDAMKTFEKCDD